MNAWSRFARQKEERTSSALTRRFELRTTTPTASYCGNPSAPCLKAPEIIPSHAQAAARPPTHNSGGRAARLYSLCSVDFSPTLLLPRRPTRRSYALRRPASFCTAVRCYKLAATQLYCGAYNKAVGCPEARLSHPRIQRSYALYPPGVCDRLGCILPLPPSETRTFGGYE